jgi:hypothetical protein
LKSTSISQGHKGCLFYTNPESVSQNRHTFPA